MEKLRFTDYLHERPAPSGVDAFTKLRHFAIVTYAVEPEAFRSLIPPRFKLDTVMLGERRMALMSVVPFVDMDFTSAVFPFPKFRFGQTNYRVYVIDQETNERVVWFLGTVLHSWTIVVPRYLWRLPWHYGQIRFDCRQLNGRYTHYEMRTRARWASASLRVEELEAQSVELAGFPDAETALVYLTHPLAGFYYRRDGKLGTYRVWHERLKTKHARCIHAEFTLLDRLGLVSFEQQQCPHSILVQPVNEFTIYLPPKVLPGEARQPRPADESTAEL